MQETKRAAFQRLATRRTNAVLQKLRVLGHCANPYAYEYSDDDVRRMFAAVEQELKLTKAKFSKRRATAQFTLE